MLERGISLPTYMAHHLSRGRAVFTREEAIAELGVKRRGFLKAAEREQRRQTLVNPRHGFYVVVPPQFLSWGAPPPDWYIDDLMRHEGHPYYVGLLKAAEQHGATHQAVMEFQVVTDKRLPKIHAGRSLISFIYRKDMASVAEAVIEQKTDTGGMRVSSPELTALDLLRYSHATGTIDSIATVLADLGLKVDAAQIAKLAPAFERTVIQRLGYLLDHLKFAEQADALHVHLRKSKQLPWIELDPGRDRDVELSFGPVERNDRWHVIVRHRPEIDE